MRISLLAVALVALPLLAACGGGDDSSSTVSASDISKVLQNGGLKDQKLADCAAKIYIDQGISQDGLRLMIKDDAKAASFDDDSFGMSKDDAAKAGAAASKIATECFSK